MIRGALGRGGLCLGALDGSALVGYVWFAYEIAPHVDGIWVKVPPRAVYRFKSFVRRSHRGRGIDQIYGDSGVNVDVLSRNLDIPLIATSAGSNVTVR